MTATPNWIETNEEALKPIFEMLLSQAESMMEFIGQNDCKLPTENQFAEMIRVGFWASMRTDESRPTRVFLALATEEMCPDVSTIEPVDFTPNMVAKLAQICPDGGCLLVDSSNDSEALQLWGIAKSLPNTLIDTAVIETCDVATVRIHIGEFRPLAVVNSEQVIHLKATESTLPLLIMLGQTHPEPDDEWTNDEQLNGIIRQLIKVEVTARLLRLIFNIGHGGTLLIVPAHRGGGKVV
ncbi:MAG: hypothetical protein K2X77_09285 [Candidatus Obscuribacterales bacterium]|jgi:hypothetical protein|nr:hypothetical protein [Candidatus Obscuribacterales bacterium]